MKISRIKLREVVESSTGTCNPSKRSEECFTYVDVAAVDNATKTIMGERSVIGAEAPSRARKLIQAGDILVSTVRPNLNAVALVPDKLDGQVASTGFCVLRATAKVIPEYLFFFVRSRTFIDGLSALVAGAMYPAVSDSQVLDQELPLPSIAEQRRIVDILSRAEGIIRLRREAQKKTAEIIPALFTNMFGDPATNPKGWKEESLGEHIDLLTGYAFKSNEFVDAANAVRLCRGANVLPQCIDWSDVRFWPKSRINEVDKFRLSEGDIVLAMDRPWISSGLKVATISSTDVPCLLVQRVARIRPRESVISEYVYSVLCHERFSRHCNAVKTETVIPHISPYDIRSFRVLVPPIPGQKRFAALADQSKSIIRQQSEALQKAEATFNALLAHTFSGQEL